MTIEEVQSLVHSQSRENLAATNDHRIALSQAMVPPKRTTVVWRKIVNDHFEDEELNAWIVGQEDSADGYKIVLRDDGKQFGLASMGFPNDKSLVLDGWYGSLLSAFWLCSTNPTHRDTTAMNGAPGVKYADDVRSINL